MHVCYPHSCGCLPLIIDTLRHISYQSIYFLACRIRIFSTLYKNSHYYAEYVKKELINSKLSVIQLCKRCARQKSRCIELRCTQLLPSPHRIQSHLIICRLPSGDHDHQPISYSTLSPRRAPKMIATASRVLPWRGQSQRAWQIT